MIKGKILRNINATIFALTIFCTFISNPYSPNQTMEKIQNDGK